MLYFTRCTAGSCMMMLGAIFCVPIVFAQAPETIKEHPESSLAQSFPGVISVLKSKSLSDDKQNILRSNVDVMFKSNADPSLQLQQQEQEIKNAHLALCGWIKRGLELAEYHFKTGIEELDKPKEDKLEEIVRKLFLGKKVQLEKLRNHTQEVLKAVNTIVVDYMILSSMGKSDIFSELVDIRNIDTSLLSLNVLQDEFGDFKIPFFGKQLTELRGLLREAREDLVHAQHMLHLVFLMRVANAFSQGGYRELPQELLKVTQGTLKAWYKGYAAARSAQEQGLKKTIRGRDQERQKENVRNLQEQSVKAFQQEAEGLNLILQGWQRYFDQHPWWKAPSFEYTLLASLKTILQEMNQKGYKVGSLPFKNQKFFAMLKIRDTQTMFQASLNNRCLVFNPVPVPGYGVIVPRLVDNRLEFVCHGCVFDPISVQVQVTPGITVVTAKDPSMISLPLSALGNLEGPLKIFLLIGTTTLSTTTKPRCSYEEKLRLQMEIRRLEEHRGLILKERDNLPPEDQNWDRLDKQQVELFKQIRKLKYRIIEEC